MPGEGQESDSVGLASQGPVLVVGLGNPGPSYSGNRHNVGFMVLDDLSRRMNVSFASHRTRAQLADGRLGVLPGGAPGPRVLLAKPMSFMNVSGGPVSAVIQFAKIPTWRLVVVHDDLDLDFGVVKLKRGGGEGGHNGLRDISKAMGSKDYVRVRVGISRPPGRQDPADYVLRDFAGSQRAELPLVVSDAADAVERVVLDGLDRAQLRYHSR